MSGQRTVTHRTYHVLSEKGGMTGSLMRGSQQVDRLCALWRVLCVQSPTGSVSAHVSFPKIPGTSTGLETHTAQVPKPPQRSRPQRWLEVGASPGSMDLCPASRGLHPSRWPLGFMGARNPPPSTHQLGPPCRPGRQGAACREELWAKKALHLKGRHPSLQAKSV